MKKEIRKEFLLEDGTKMYFHNLRFEQVIKSKLQIYRDEGKKKSKQELLGDIQDKTGVSVSSMNHWIMGHNAPGDLESIKLVANELGVKVETILLNELQMENGFERKEASKMGNAERNILAEVDSKTAIREIYVEMVDFIEEFRNTNGFEYKNKFSSEPYCAFEAQDRYDTLGYNIRINMLDIPLKTYNELFDFATGYLESFLGSEYEFLWDVETYTDEECVQKGYDITKFNPYYRKFIGYVTFLKQENETDSIDTRQQYVETLCDTAYKLLQQILSEYLIK